MSKMTKRVLIVNCSPDRASMLRNILASEASLKVVGTVFDGKEALDIAQAIKPEILFTCIALPSMSGIQLARKLKQLMPSISIIVGTLQAEMEQEAFAAGADAFLAYPVSHEEIIESFRNVQISDRRGLVPEYPTTRLRLDISTDPPPEFRIAKLRRALDVLGRSGFFIGAYFALAIVYSILGLQDSPKAGAIYGGTFAVLAVIYWASTILRRELLSDEEKKAEDDYADWLSGQRGP